MASGFPGRDLRGGFGFGIGPSVKMYQQRSDGGPAIGAAGLLKRSVTEIERQQQMQNASYLRSVKQKTQFTWPSAVDLSAVSTATTSSVPSSFSSSTASTQLVGQGVPNSMAWSFQETIAETEIDPERKSSMTSKLLELERQLLNDEDEVSISDSVVTNNEWNETMQKLVSPPMATIVNMYPLSPSPTTSTSSSSGSSSSCALSSATTARQMLIDTAAAIIEGNQETAAANLSVLKRTANPRGDPDQRLTAMMVAALVARINQPSPENSHSIDDVCSAEHQAASQLLYEASPCFKLGLMAANLSILEATNDNLKIHILDFDIGQGGQLASLIHSISERHRQLSRTRPTPCLKITAICSRSGKENSNLSVVGDRLSKLAEQLGIGLRFSIVYGRIKELDRTTLLCEPGEALAVNFAFFLSQIADESVSPENPRDELLRLVKSLSPRIVTLVEQEMNGNTAPFATRFSEACSHFGALLESLDSAAARDSTDRARVEACLARKAANSIAREGSDRVERCEMYGKWRARMGMAGFKPLNLGLTVSEPVKLRLSSLRNNPGFTVKEEAEWLGCGWMGRVLTVASAWH